MLAAELLDEQMHQFLAWFNGPTERDPVLKAGGAHIWLVTIHPFDNGNGRIARALADLLPARAVRAAPKWLPVFAQPLSLDLVPIMLTYRY